jgi:hypothetical protein
VSTKALRHNDGYVEDAAKIATDLIQKGENVRIIGSQEFTGNQAQEIEPHEKRLPLTRCHGSKIQLGHFNALRGLNEYKDCDSGIILGRNQPPVYAIENLARAFFRLDDNPLQMGSEKIPMAYQMSDGSQEYANVWRMKDDRCQFFLDSIREEESLQAIDRLRLTHYQGKPKKVFVLSNVPLPGLLVDELLTTRDIRGTAYLDKSEVMINRFCKRLALK